MKHAATLLVAGMLAAAPAAAVAQTIAGGVMPSLKIFVVNNSAASLTCHTSKDAENWGDWFAFNPGAEFSGPVDPNTSTYFYCQAPMRSVLYSLHPGRRYSILPAGDGALELRDIEA